MIPAMTHLSRHPRRTAPLVTALAAVLFAAAPAQAQELHLRYQAYWGGLHVADFALSLIDGDGAYENRFHLETRGFTRFLSNMSVKAKSQGRLIAPPPPGAGLDNGAGGADRVTGPTFLAEHYRTEYTNRKHFRWVDITFGAKDEPAKAVTGTEPIPGREDNWNPDEKGPEVLDRVEDEHLIAVNDPITMIPQMMAIVKTHLEGGPASGVAKGFDGRRRFDMDITYLGPATRTIDRVKHNTYHVRVTPMPGPGFKERHRAVWNGSLYDFYLSRDGRFVPLQIVPVKHGPVLTLVAECPSECDIPVEED